MLPFVLYADFESIGRPVDERYRDKMNRMKAERKSKAPYTEKISKHVPSGWCVHRTFTYGDVPDSLKMYRGKDCVEKFVEYIEKVVICNISTAAYDRAYRCVEKRTRGSKKVSHLPQSV